MPIDIELENQSNVIKEKVMTKTSIGMRFFSRLNDYQAETRLL